MIALLDVLPSLAAQSHSERYTRDAVLACQSRYSLAFRAPLSASHDSLVSQTSQDVSLSAYRRRPPDCAAPLRGHIRCVVSLRPLKEMTQRTIVSNAWRVVTSMQGVHPRRQRSAEHHLQRNAVRLQRRLSGPTGIDGPISVTILCANPEPARRFSFALDDLFPETFFKRTTSNRRRTVERGTRATAKALLRAFRISNARRSTVLAGKMTWHRDHSSVSCPRGVRTARGLSDVESIP